ncbi:MAG: hypothetical protein OXG69_12020 [bacterium]|nr:hypothetical protein [bacterium]
MTEAELECPDTAEHLYLAAALHEVEASRPVLTGDVFEDVVIPGVAGSGLRIVLTHPCSMRSDGVSLARRLLMARVVAGRAIPLKEWKTGHFKVMPLPLLLGAQYSARFEDMGMVESKIVRDAKRLACPAPYGINLLQQQFVWSLTRFMVPTHRLGEASEAVFEEVDLCTEWVSEACSAGCDSAGAERAFHEWIRSTDESGMRRQDLLREPQRRAGIRQEMRRRINRGKLAETSQ